MNVVPNGRSALTGVKVLVVENTMPSARLFEVLLANEGCEVQTALGAEAAIERLKTFTPRVAIVDLFLPGMSALWLVQQLRAAETTKDAIIIATSVASGAHVPRVALQNGCTAYVRKPIDVHEFPHLVTSLVKGRA